MSLNCKTAKTYVTKQGPNIKCRTQRDQHQTMNRTTLEETAAKAIEEGVGTDTIAVKIKKNVELAWGVLSFCMQWNASSNATIKLIKILR